MDNNQEIITLDLDLGFDSDSKYGSVNNEIIFNDFSEKIWEFIQKNEIEEYKKLLLAKEDILEECLLIKALYLYVIKDKQAKKEMLKVVKKNLNNQSSSHIYFELIMFTVDKLKEFYNDKKTNEKLSTYVIQSTIDFNSKELRFYYDVFKLVCDSGFFIINNTNLNEKEIKNIYFILFHFLHNLDYYKLSKENYKIYLRYYLRVVWYLRDELTNLAKELFLPAISGIIYKSMELDSKEEKIKKLSLFGFDEDIADELINFSSNREFLINDDIPF